MADKSVDDFRFIKTDRVGHPAAEDDADFLDDCFVETGDLGVLRDTKSPQCVIVGRTGSGKTALLQRLRRLESKVIEIAPEELSLSYLANSTILPKLEEMGVDLDLFYRALWRHIFAVELIKAKYNPREEEQGFIDRILGSIFPDERKKRALRYLEEFGTSFWKETEIRVQEISHHFETEIKEQLGGELDFEIGKISGELGESEREAVTRKAEIVRRAQEVVAQKQLAQLGPVIDILAEIFEDPQPRYYIVIDQLDEGWIVERFRYRLIRALIETLRDFRKVPSAKIIVALRRDLLQHVVRMTRDAGFQEEKYESLYLPVTWEKDQLLLVLDERVRKLVRRRYTKAVVGWRDLLPERVGSKSVDKYLLERTQYRPRDLIAFFNECIAKAVGSPKISVNVLRTAEAEYSRGRLRALGDEWQREYPLLQTFASGLLERRPGKFRVSDVTDEQIEKVALANSERIQTAVDEVGKCAFSVCSGDVPAEELRRRIFTMFHTAGVVGLQLDPKGAVVWTYRQRPAVSEAEVRPETMVEVAPMLYRVLGIDAE